MILIPYSPIETIEYDYAIIDLNLNANYYLELKDKMISLAPDYANEVKKSFPYLIRLNTIHSDLMDEICRCDLDKIKEGSNPFFLFTFRSIPKREPDIVNHLKETLVYESNGKKYLYRFYDPKVWILLNYFESTDFFEINKYCQNIKIGLLNKIIFFKNRNKIKKNFSSVFSYELISDIGLFNQIYGLLRFDLKELVDYFDLVEDIFFYIKFCKIKGMKESGDIVSAVFHIMLIGESYINSDLFMKLKKSIRGYEQQSKMLLTEEWSVFFEQNKIIDKELKNKVMYEY